MKTKKDLIQINKQQAEYYNSENSGDSSNRGFFTKYWNNFRNGPMNVFMKKYEIRERFYDMHKEWLTDLENKKVLDLGCLRGNKLSLFLAERAQEYIGIDLSDVAIAELNRKLSELNKPKAKGVAVDFLSDDFKERDFDVVYAHGVLHHFENFQVMLDRLKEVLKPGGIVISYDPLETSLPVKMIRAIYRPFQEDADWEWPFTRKTLKKLDAEFKVESVHGILGKSKYGLLLDMLPLRRAYKEQKIKDWIDADWNTTDIMDVTDCMHVTMRLVNK